MSGVIVSAVILAIIIGVAAYIFLSRKQEVVAALAVPPFSEWTISHTTGATTKAAKGADGLFYFDFPKDPQSNNYITTVSPKLAVGQTLRLKFSITGTGKILPHEPNSGPARLRLMLWRQGDDLSGLSLTTEFYRLWSTDVQIPGAGDYELAVKLYSTLWTGVWGKPAPDTGKYTTFPDVLANIALIGFSLGSSSAGHGCYVADGDARLTIKSYAVE